MTRYWAVNRAAADEVGGVQQKRQFSQKVMVWLSACSKAITPLVILDVPKSNEMRDNIKLYNNDEHRNNEVTQQQPSKSNISAREKRLMVWLTKRQRLHG
ncbi:unnamed protein product [Didymodactylos carnosus]|uniref:Uncharacterized protein n=1 Tax=Didymodactylos carnosus TaxID=1234261 RepID=A0A8S2DWK3_9BILA|nr:unnamed protein product [Didymodactylos carnosus]CAF3788946.1 unnamed protein product [Didymodactylos carnosus]